MAEKDIALLTIVVTMCILSMIGSVLIIVSYLKWADLRTVSRRLLVFLSIADFWTAAGNFWGSLDNDNKLSCTMQSALTTYSSMASFFWTTYIALYLYLCMPGNSNNPEKAVKWFHLTAWFVPLMIIIIAVSMGALGPSEVGWCWIDESKEHDLMWAMFTGKMWEIASYIATFALYAVIHYKIQNSKKNLSNGAIKRYGIPKTDVKLLLIPLIFIIIRIWGTIHFVYIYVIETEAPYVLVILQGLGDSSQGFANAILFCIFTKKVRQRYLKCLFGVQYEDEETVAILSREQNKSVNVV